MLLEVRSLTKRFGGLTAVADVSFSIAKGEIVGILGPNGSGKTTVLNMISGLMRPSAGAIAWKLVEIQGRPPHEIAAAGLVKTFQSPKLFTELTALEHLQIASHLALKRRLGWRRLTTLFAPAVEGADGALLARAEQVLRLCRLEGARDSTAAELSYGAEKMLGVAMALMCEPELLLLDEPASGLGVAEIENLEAVLRDLTRHGTTLCIVDHKVGFLCRLADRVIGLHHGAKIAEGRPDEVLRDPNVVMAYLGCSRVGV
jgi:ABC-type branched-subunit amino acid transport system ATPase component